MKPRSFFVLVGFLGVEGFHGPAKLDQVGADPGVLVDGLDRPVEEAVRRAGGLGDLLAAHRGQLIDLLAELGAVGVERRKLVDELARRGCRARSSLRSSAGTSPAASATGTGCRASGGSSLSLVAVPVAATVSGAGSVAIFQSFPCLSRGLAATVNGNARPCKRLPLYYRCNTEPCNPGATAEKVHKL